MRGKKEGLEDGLNQDEVDVLMMRMLYLEYGERMKRRKEKMEE